VVYRRELGGVPAALAETDDRLLDVGGPRTITVDFADRLTDGIAVGIDAAPAAVAATHALVAERAVQKCHALNGRRVRAGVPAGSFDVVHAHQVLQHLSDLITAGNALRLRAGRSRRCEMPITRQ
jgi:hypothetical protein